MSYIEQRCISLNSTWHYTLNCTEIHSHCWWYNACHQETISTSPRQEEPTLLSMYSPLQASYSLIWGTPATLHCTVLRYTCNTALFCFEIHIHHCTVLYWGTPAALHYTVLRKTCNTELYCIKVHLQHCTLLYWGKTALYISIFRLFTLLDEVCTLLLIFHALTEKSRIRETKHYTTIHYITLHYTTLHYTTLHYTTLHYKLHYPALYCTALE